MTRIARLWRTTTVRLTFLFILIFSVFAILLLGLITWQSSIQIQQQQTRGIDAEIAAIERADVELGLRGVALAVERLARQPGPGFYYLGDPTGQIIVGNVFDLPVEILQTPGVYSFSYERLRPFASEDPEEGQGFAVVRSTVLPSGLILVVGRDVVERQGFTAIIFQSFLFGVVGILLFSLLAGGLTARRVLARIETINATSSMIMSGNLAERVPLTRRNDEFDELARNLNAMLDRIEKLLQGLKEVTDNVAHDLKTPLTRLRNNAESALREGATDAERREALETTIAESDRLIRTFNALLMIARAEAGAPSGAMVPVDLSAIVADVAELYGPLAEDDGLTLAADIAEGVTVRANRELIGQALVNLLENALKYGRPATGEGGIAVTLRRAGASAVIEVADAGVGIPQEDRARVLERFVRLEASRTEPGSGLGLSLVDAVARLHRGAFRLEDNAPGVRAVMELPLA